MPVILGDQPAKVANVLVDLPQRRGWNNGNNPTCPALNMNETIMKIGSPPGSASLCKRIVIVGQTRHTAPQ